MSDFQLTNEPGYQALVDRISAVYTYGQLQAHRAVNEHLTRTFWQIGHDIVEYEQGGQTRAAYGQSLITNLSRDLRLRHGKGFSRSNVIRARQFYLAYPKGATLSHLLSWSHVVELLKLDDPLERGFYEQQCALEKWAVRELQRQIKSSLFLRLAAERNTRFPSLVSVIRKFRITADAGKPNETDYVLANPPFNHSATALRACALPRSGATMQLVSAAKDHFHKDNDVRWQPSRARQLAKGNPQGKRADVHQFYTPSCVVRRLVEMLAPHKGRIYDPACGFADKFVQPEKFVESHGGKLGDISISSQDKWARRQRPFGFAKRARRVRLQRKQPNQSNPTTRRFAIMNLALRGIEADFSPENADTFRRELHPDLLAA